MNPRESEFEKKEKLGAGSFGTVWLVQQRSGDALFALKEIDLRKPGMQQAMKEVETMTRLPPHRNVVRLHEHWTSKDGKDMWLLLEYCSQGMLAQQFLMSSARLPDAALWDLSGQLLQALLLFERHRIVHNDIKPENIFIMEGSIPKIGDLGMARFTSAGSVLTKTPGGTPLFQAPEVLSKDTNIVGADCKPALFPEYAACEVSYQSDVYSVGVVLWSMVMRRNPDRPGGAFPLTPALVPDSSLRELVNDMLQPDPAKRHRASHLVLRFTAPAPAPAPAPFPDVGSTVCILRDDGSDRTLLRVRPTNSRSDDAFVTPKVAIYGVDRLQLLQTTTAEGSSFSLVKTSSGVEGYVQSKYIAFAPAIAKAAASHPAPTLPGTKYVHQGEHVLVEGIFIYDGYVPESDNMYHGTGKCWHPNGSVYEGEFKDGKMEGRGKQTFPDGEVYEGEWKDGIRSGIGKCKFVDGRVYEGEYKDDKKEGRGKQTWPSGDVYEGEWKGSRFNGRGKCEFADGRVYEGEWKEDKFHGQGCMTFANRSRENGTWRDGNFLG